MKMAVVGFRVGGVIAHEIFSDICADGGRETSQKTMRLKTVFILKLVLTTAEHRFCYTKLQVNIERTLTKGVGPAVNEENQWTDDLDEYS